MSCDNSEAATNALTDALSEPRRVESDYSSAEQHPIPDLIKADQYLAGKCASKGKRRGLRFNKLVPDGTAGSCQR